MADPIKVVILCGGVGTRLREETEFCPKPMVNIGSYPIIWHIMKYYSQFGCKDFVLKGGFFVFNRKILDYLTTDDLCDLEIGPLEQIAKEGQLMVYKHREFWACMDTLRDMESLNKIWNEGKA